MIHESEVAINVTIIFLSSCPQLNELVHPSYQNADEKKKKSMISEIHWYQISRKDSLGMRKKYITFIARVI